VQPNLVLLGFNKSKIDENLRKIIHFHGLSCDFFDSVSEKVIFEIINKKEKDKGHNLILNFDFIKKLGNTGRPGLINSLIKNFDNILIYNLYPSKEIDSALKKLSNNKISSVSNLNKNDNDYIISEFYPDITRQLSGLSFGPVDSDHDFKIELSSELGIDKIISIDSYPFFIKLQVKGKNIFVLPISDVIDIDLQVNADFEFADIFSKFFPISMFLRYVFGNHCWKASLIPACMIIDDPLLKTKYGFLNYQKLFKIMDQYDFSTNIAFIPYNWARSRPNVVNLLKQTKKYSLSFHGCYHNEKECCKQDTGLLNNIFQTAKIFMDKHTKMTGLEHGRIMVFPQGCFSVNAMKVLKANNFLAVVNTKILPEKEDVKLSFLEMLSPVVTFYGGMPLFLRRYPKNLKDFFFDMFLEKPVLIVEHHDYFKNGYAKLIGFITGLNAFKKTLKWGELNENLRKFYITKEIDNDRIEIQLITNDTILKSSCEKRQIAMVKKKENNEVPIKKILIDGLKLKHFSRNGGNIEFEIVLEPNIEKTIKIIYKNPYQSGNIEQGVIEKLKIFLRRRLTEVRDEYISKDERLLNAVSKYKNKLKRLTG
jgi:hypothetical protein